MFLVFFVLAGLYTPEECLAVKAKPAVTAEYAGKSYRLANTACRDEFLSDPERFSQLYDAILELQAEGNAIAQPRDSLVPS